MQKAGLRGVSRRGGFLVTTQRDAKSRSASHLVNRNFVAEGPNRSWVADMTYVDPTWAGLPSAALAEGDCRAAFGGHDQPV
jgi:putative transposase